MFLMDVNVLVYAHREDIPDHLAYREWLESVINGNGRFFCYAWNKSTLKGMTFLMRIMRPWRWNGIASG